MKKFMYAAMCAAMFVFGSCDRNAVLDIEEEEKVLQSESCSANFAHFDESIEKSEILFAICEDIINAHKEIEIMREALPEVLVEKIDGKSYSLYEAVEIIFIWYKNLETYDLMCEWPTWDDFRPALNETELSEIFRFCR